MPYQYTENEAILCPSCGSTCNVPKDAIQSYCFCGYRIKPPMKPEEIAREGL